MLLDVSDALRNPGKAFPFRHEEKLEDQDVLGEVISFKNPCLLSGTFVGSEGSVTLEGKLETVVSATCSRCLSPLELKLSVPFAEQFVRRSNKGAKTEIEDDEDMQMFEGYQIDLENLALSLALLELPIRFLCKEDCEGMKEWQALNDEANACQEALNVEHPFAALQKMLTKDQEV